MIDKRTNGECQTPIHYAAKNNAVEALKVLIHMGANIGDRDYKHRTPLFVAAETGKDTLAMMKYQLTLISFILLFYLGSDS